MIVCVQTGKGWTKKIRKVFENNGWIIVENPEEADLVISEEAHLYKPTIVVGKVEEDLMENVIDVLSPKDCERYIKIRLKLYQAYLTTGGFEDYLEEEFSKAVRYTLPLSLVIFKITEKDNKTLEKLIVTAKRYSRISDKFFKLSDDEVVMVLPGTDEDGANVFVKRLIRRWHREYLKETITKKPSFIYGIASIEDWMLSAEDLLASAEYDLLKKIR